MKEYTTKFGDYILHGRETENQYRNWWYAHSYSFLAFHTKSKIIALSDKKNNGEIKSSYYNHITN